MAGTIRELSRRPAVLLGLALAAGLTVREFPLAALVGMGAFACAAGLRWRIAMAAATGIGFLLAPSAGPRAQTIDVFRGEATVANSPRLSGDRQICEVESAGNPYRLIAPGEPVLAAGDLVSLSGELRPAPTDLPEIGDRAAYVGQLFVEPGGLKVVHFGAAPFRQGVAWRKSFVDYVARMMRPESAAAVDALCFNVTSGLEAETYENLQRTGTVHIISASGLHVLIFALGLRFLLALLPIPRGAQLAIIGIVLAIYAIGAGMRPPVVRSVVMAGILGTAGLFRREPDLLSALAAAGAGYLIWRPDAIFDIGFQLSFAAVAGLALLGGRPSRLPAKALPRLTHGVLEAGRASGIATLATAPLTAYYFGAVSLIAIPANVLIALALAPLTLTAFAAHAMSGIVPALSAGLMVGVVEPLSGWVLWVVDTLGPLSFASLSIPAFSAYWMLPYYGVLILFWRPRARPA